MPVPLTPLRVSRSVYRLNGITVPGTLCDSLVLLSVVLEQQTELQQTEIMDKLQSALERIRSEITPA